MSEQDKAIPDYAKLVKMLKSMRRERIHGMDEWRLVLPDKESDELYALLAALESEAPISVGKRVNNRGR